MELFITVLPDSFIVNEKQESTMKKVKIFIIMVILCLPFISEWGVQAAGEFVNYTTWGFEGGTGNWSNNGAGSITVVQDEYKNGSNSLKVTNRKALSDGPVLDVSTLMNGKKVIHAKAFIKQLGINSQTARRFNITIKCNAGYYVVVSKSILPNQWTEMSGGVVLPDYADISNAKIIIETSWVAEPTAEADFMDYYVDDFSFGTSSINDTSSYPSLKNLFGDLFKVGTAVPDSALDIQGYKQHVIENYNSITMENEMKPDYILDKMNSTNEVPAVKFNAAKDLLDFAKENGIGVRGHTLVWHSQTPTWFFYNNYDVNGTLASRELMLKRMENYIKSVMEWTETNYPGVIYAWDVANECIIDPWGNEDKVLRESLWKQTIGDDFVAYAFKFSRQYAAAGVKLFYNDYNEYFDEKQKDIISVLKPIVEAGNIDGMGMQSHIDSQFDIDNFYMTSLKKYATELGVEIQITELDAGQNPKPGEDAEVQQGEFYRNLIAAVVKARKEGVKITSVTFWGISDGNSWRKESAPLLLNADLSYKAAFSEIVSLGNQVKADDVEKKILEIVTVSLDSKTKIEAARTMYNSLTQEQKALVINYADLIKAESDYQKLAHYQSDYVAASEVIGKTADIGTVTLNSKMKIDVARSAYNQLTQTQKGMVTNYSTLTTAESVYAQLIKEYEDSQTPVVTATPLPTSIVTPTATPFISPVPTSSPSSTVKLNQVYTIGNYRYKVLSLSKRTVSIVKAKTKDLKSIIVPDMVIIYNKAFKVVSVGKSAFYNSKKVTNVTIGKNIKVIDSKAFYGCSKLKSVKIRSNKLTSVGKRVFYNVYKAVKIKVPSSKLKLYKKLLGNKESVNGIVTFLNF